MLVRTLIASAAALSLAGAAHSASHAESAPAATATLMDQSGVEVGTVEIFETSTGGLLFSVEATGMPEGGHGFHVHETGECSGDFTSAGDHYQPGGNSHGLLAGEGAHAGDLPNVFAGADGNLRADLTSAVLSIEGGEAPVMDDDGSAIIVHENPDSYGEDAGAGGRIACGVIEAS